MVSVVRKLWSPCQEPGALPGYSFPPTSISTVIPELYQECWLVSLRVSWVGVYPAKSSAIWSTLNTITQRWLPLYEPPPEVSPPWYMVDVDRSWLALPPCASGPK